MSFYLSDKDYKNMMGMLYGDNKDSGSSGYYLGATESAKPQQQGLVADTVDAVQMGAWQGLGDIAHGLGALTGADWLHKVGDWAGEGADENLATMSDEMKAALNQSAFDGEGQGVRNIRWWAGNLGSLIGQNLDTALTLGVGKAATFGVKQAGKLLLKKQAAEQVGKTAVEQAAKRGIPQKYWNMVGITATMSAMSGGSRYGQKRDEVMQMTNDQLAEIPQFSDTYYAIKDSEEGQGKSIEELYEMSKSAFADKVGRDAALDPTAIATDLATNAVSGLGGGFLGLGSAAKTVKGGLLKGALTEGGTEAIQGVAEQYALNKAERDNYNPNKSLTDGMADNAINGAILGGVFGSVMGGLDSHTERRAFNNQKQKLLNYINTGNESIDEQLRNYVDTINQGAADLDDLVSASRVQSLNMMGTKQARAEQVMAEKRAQDKAQAQFEADFFGEEMKQESAEEVAPEVDPNLERALELHAILNQFHNNNFSRANEFISTPMIFANDEAKKRYVTDRAFDEVRNIAQSYGIDSSNGSIMRQWLEEYAAKVKGNDTSAPQSATPESDLQHTANIAPEYREGVIAGSSDQIDVGQGHYQPFQYEVMNAAALQPTQQKNDNQFRDRDRSASQAQINQIARNLDPRKLAASPTMDMGAPLLALDGKTIIAGNGRTMAIRQAYQEGGAEGYRQFLKDNAHHFGVDSAQLDSFDNPVLVRRLTTPVDIAQVAINSNEQGGMRMSDLEQAKVDARRLPSMDTFSLGENGEINTPDNQTFIRQFIQNQPENLRNELLDSQGQLSQSGVQRMRNAMLYQAYGDSQTLSRLIENTDQGAKNVLNALTALAPKVAQVQQDIRAGVLVDVGISNDIIQAVEKYNQLNAQGHKVGDYLAQEDFVGDLSPEAREVLTIFDENRRSGKRIAQVLGAYFDQAQTQGNLSQASIFGDVMFDKLGSLKQAKNVDEDIRLSLNESANSDFAKAVDNVANGEFSSQIIDVGTTPSVLKMLGLPDTNVVISSAVLKKVMLGKHNVTPDTLKQLPKQINDPVAVMQSSTQQNGYVVLTELMENVNGINKPVVAALHLKQTSQGIELINIASVYGRNNSQIQRGLENDLLYWNKKKGANFLDNLTLQLRSPLSETNSTKGINFTDTFGLQLPAYAPESSSLLGQNVKTEFDLSQYLSAKNNQKSTINPEVQRAKAILTQTFGKAADNIDLVSYADLNAKPEFVEMLQRDGIEGWFNRKTGKITIVVDSIKPKKTMTKEERLQFVVWHELAHRGINVRYKNQYETMMAEVGRNKMVSQIAEAIYQDRKNSNKGGKPSVNDLAATQRTVAIEEALAEIMAAHETGKWNELMERYGVDIRKGQIQSTKSWLAMTAQRIKDFLVKLFGVERAGQFSDEDVLNLIAGIKQSAVENVNEESGVRFSRTESHFNDVDFERATPKRTANSFAQVKELAKAFLNKTLHNDETGIEAVVSRANLDKMLSGKAHAKSTSLHDHLIAVANVDSLFKNAIHGWTESYNKNDSPDVVGVHKMFAPLNIDGNVKLVKLTVKELKPEQGNRVYSVETIEIGDEKAPMPEMAELGFDSNSHRLHEGSGYNANVQSLIQRIQDFNSRNENSDIRFSRVPSKQTEPYQRDLMVTHNISAEGILHADKMGGLPFASVAVAKQSHPLTGFGEVTLIGSRDYIDPKGTNKAKVFGSDIYSPRYPRISYEYSAKDQKALFDRFKESAKEIEDHSFDYNFTQGLSDTGARQAMLDSDAVKHQFLKQHNIPYEQGYREIKSSPYTSYPSVQKAIELGVTSSDLERDNSGKYDSLFREFIQDFIQQQEKNDNPLIKNTVVRAKQALKSGGNEIKLFAVRRMQSGLDYRESSSVPDRAMTLSNMRKAVEQNRQAFREYVDSIANGMEAKEKIWNGTDNQGRNRYVAHTLENVVKKLKKDLRGGESFNYGMPNVRAAVTPKFKTIADIQENKHRLVSNEEFEQAKSQMDAESEVLAEKLGVNAWEVYDVLWNAVDENISKAFGYADIEDTPSNRKAVSDFLSKLEAMPTEYFEGKAKDVTQFSDFAGAVVPNDMAQKAYDVLVNAGLKMFTYDSSDPQSRANAIKRATNQLDELTGGEILFSRSNTVQSALELSQSAKAQNEPSLVESLASRDFTGFKDKLNRAVSKADEWFADSLRPVNDWIDNLHLANQTGHTSSRDHEKRRLKDSMYTAKGKRDSLNSELEQAYLKPILAKLAALSKATKKGKNPIDELTMKRMVGNWISARYAIEKNQELLRREEQTMLEAKRLLDNAKQNGSRAEINRLSNAYAKAKEQYENRKADIYNTDYKNKGNRFKVGVAGGWSIPEAQLIMKNTEQHISRSDLESVANMVYDLNQARLEIDRASGRYTEKEYREYQANRHYVPLTGDPNADVDTDMISGAGSSAVNIGRDKSLQGRTTSEAEDAIDAIWKSVGKTTTYAGFAEFKAKIDDLYETEVSLLKDKGFSDYTAREQATANLGISKHKMQGLTRSSDNVLIRKEGGQYYEYALPDNVMAALRNDNVEHANDFLKTLSKPTGWYARGVTQWTLTFAPMNMIRDTLEKSEFIRVQKLYGKNHQLVDSRTMDKIGRATIANAFANKEIWQATKRFGFGQPLRDNVPAERLLKQLLQEGGLSTYGTYLAKTETDLVNKLKKANSPLGAKLEKAGRLVEGYNQMFDTVSALAAYKALVDNGIDSKQAAAATLELTNFRKTGSKMRGIKALYMFSQPTVMGAANLMRYLSTRKGQVRFAVHLVGGMALYTLLRSMDDEDEGGNKMDQLGDITRYIPLPLGNGHYFKLPVGFGMQQLAWNAATNLVKGMAGDISFSEMGANMFAHAFKTFAPVSPSEISAAKFPMEKIALTITPTMLQPLMQNVVNRSAFGSKITTNFVRDDKLKAEQSKATTAQFWKDVALDLHDSMGIDMHPEQIKNLVDGYSSALGSLKELSTIFVENPNREKLGRHTRMPFVSQFIGTTNEFSIQSRYYEASEEARQLAAEYVSRKERHQLDGWLDDKGDKKRLIQWHEMNESQIKTLRREKSALTKALREGKISAIAYERRLERYNKEASRLQGKLLYHWRNLQKLNTSKN